MYYYIELGEELMNYILGIDIGTQGIKGVIIYSYPQIGMNMMLRKLGLFSPPKVLSQTISPW